MVAIVKHEWHSVDSQFIANFDEALLQEIYPDDTEEEIAQKLTDIESGELDIETVIEDAYENNVDIDWDRGYDDWYTERKGGYEVTYELMDE